VGEQLTMDVEVVLVGTGIVTRRNKIMDQSGLHRHVEVLLVVEDVTTASILMMLRMIMWTDVVIRPAKAKLKVVVEVGIGRMMMMIIVAEGEGVAETTMTMTLLVANLLVVEERIMIIEEVEMSRTMTILEALLLVIVAETLKAETAEEGEIETLGVIVMTMTALIVVLLLVRDSPVQELMMMMTPIAVVSEEGKVVVLLEVGVGPDVAPEMATWTITVIIVVGVTTVT